MTIAEQIVGSSPRVWGQVFVDTERLPVFGIIPTRVGTSFTSSFGEKCGEDHPHACGDKASVSAGKDTLPGSSPRVWGQAIFCCVDLLVARIIPTRVGTSADTSIFFNFSQDHPHACGDKFSAFFCSSSCLGSSPRVWGQVTVTRLCKHTVRIIPTRVGTSIRSL